MTNITNVGSGYVSNRSTVERPDRTPAETMHTHAAHIDGDAKDTAHLSNTANALSAAAGATDDARSGRVEALRAAVQAGTYNVPTNDVADAVLKTLLS